MWYVFLVSMTCLVSTASPSELEDKSPYCAAWAATGECAKNPKYMQQACARSCARVQQQSMVQETMPTAPNIVHESLNMAQHNDTHEFENRESVQETMSAMRNDPHESNDMVDSVAELLPSKRKDLYELDEMTDSVIEVLPAWGNNAQESNPMVDSARHHAPGSVNNAHEFHDIVDSRDFNGNAIGSDVSGSHCQTADSDCSQVDSSNTELATVDVVELRAMLLQCRYDREQRITDARKHSFEELIDFHDKEIADELRLQERNFNETIGKLKREAIKTELLLKHQLKQMEERAREAEEKLRRITTGEETRAAVARAVTLAESLSAEEQHRLRMEKQFQDALDEAKARENAMHLRMKASEHTAQAAVAEAKMAKRKTDMMRRSRRRLLMKSRLSLVSFCDAHEDHEQPRWMLDCAAKHDSLQNQNGTRGSQRSTIVASAEQMEGSLRASVLEAMQILSPLQDLTIMRMHAELCVVQQCSRSKALNVTAWLAAFAWVALWRCAWVLTVRYIIICLGKLLAWCVHLCDIFGDWFLRLDRQNQLATREF